MRLRDPVEQVKRRHSVCGARGRVFESHRGRLDKQAKCGGDWVSTTFVSIYGGSIWGEFRYFRMNLWLLLQC